MMRIAKLRKRIVGIKRRVERVKRVRIPKHKLGKCYVVISPDGAQMNIRNLSEFARKAGLNRKCLDNCAQGKQQTHKGYRVFLPDEEILFI